MLICENADKCLKQNSYGCTHKQPHEPQGDCVPWKCTMGSGTDRLLVCVETDIVFDVSPSLDANR